MQKQELQDQQVDEVGTHNWANNTAGVQFLLYLLIQPDHYRVQQVILLHFLLFLLYFHIQPLIVLYQSPIIPKPANFLSPLLLQLLQVPTLINFPKTDPFISFRH